MKKMFLAGLFGLALQCSWAAGTWQVDLRSKTGPIASIQLPDSAGKKRSAMVTFEIARRCDPMLVFVELSSSQYGKPIKQELLNSTKIGALVNGKFFTGTAAKTTYTNGFEVGFAMPEPMATTIVFMDVNSIILSMPDGSQMPLPLTGLKSAITKAVDACSNKF